MGEEEEAIDHSPLIQREPSRRTGNVWSAVAHIITGVIGAGVLSLAWAMAQLGWIAGPLFILAFAVTTFFSSFLLSDCYRFPDPEHGVIRNSSYMAAVKMYLGDKRQKACGVLAFAGMYGTTAAYVITTANCISARSLSAIAKKMPMLAWAVGPTCVLLFFFQEMANACLVMLAYYSHNFTFN